MSMGQREFATKLAAAKLRVRSATVDLRAQFGAVVRAAP